jgi:calpain-7
MDQNGLGPMMSTSCSIDLVQDAATDCSVVASLCAGIARSERGHDKVRESLGHDSSLTSADAFQLGMAI